MLVKISSQIMSKPKRGGGSGVAARRRAKPSQDGDATGLATLDPDRLEITTKQKSLGNDSGHGETEGNDGR